MAPSLTGKRPGRDCVRTAESSMNILHIRLRGDMVAALKRRAKLAEISSADYVERVLWYSVLESSGWERRDQEPVFRDDEIIYFSAPLSEPLRMRLVSRSAEESQNVAVHAGALVECFLGKFERDPGDLRMLARLSEMLERGGLLTEQDLLEVLRLAEETPVSRMPVAFQTRWLHQRFRAFMSRITVDGAPVELTVEWLAALRKQAKGDPARE